MGARAAPQGCQAFGYGGYYRLLSPVFIRSSLLCYLAGLRVHLALTTIKLEALQFYLLSKKENIGRLLDFKIDPFLFLEINRVCKYFAFES